MIDKLAHRVDRRIAKLFKAADWRWWLFAGSCCDRLFAFYCSFARAINQSVASTLPFERGVREMWRLAHGKAADAQLASSLVDECKEFILDDDDFGEPQDLYGLGQSASIGLAHTFLLATNDSTLDYRAVTDFLRETALGRLHVPGQYEELDAWYERELKLQLLALDELDRLLKPTPAKVEAFRGRMTRESDKYVDKLMSTRFH